MNQNYDLMSQSIAKITIHGLQLLLNSDLRAMAVNDWSASRPFLLKSDLRLAMAVKYSYTTEIGVLNIDLRFVVLC